MADVVGLDTFVSHFEGHEESYVLIGGAACSLWLGAQGLPFRRTRDLDIVIVIEGTSDEFFQLLWQFIEDGNYRSRERGTAKPQFYRFYDPASVDYPYMIELLTRNLLELPDSAHLTPMPIGEEISSLSAILLEDTYYQFVLDNRQQIQGATTIPGHCLIPLKAKAWLDLTGRRNDGDETVRSNDIRKHRNDVFRLLIAIPPADRIPMPSLIRDDLRLFLEKVSADEVTWTSIEAAVNATSPNALPNRNESIDLIEKIFKL